MAHINLYLAIIKAIYGYTTCKYHQSRQNSCVLYLLQLIAGTRVAHVLLRTIKTHFVQHFNNL